MLPLKPANMEKGSYSRTEEQLSGLSHALGAVLSVMGLMLLVNSASDSTSIVIAWVYGLSLITMFSSSTLYHLSQNPQRRQVLRKVDHIAIYLLIAGSYTPFLAFTLSGWQSTLSLVVIWLVAVAGIVFKLRLGHRFPKVSIVTYGVMGWLALFLIYPIYLGLPLTGFILLVLGGLCYSAGIPLYLLKSRHYSHALWHVCVVAGAACHFFAIYLYIFSL